MQRPIACFGLSFTVVYAINGHSVPGYEFFAGLDEEDQGKITALFKRMAERGKIVNEEKFKHINETNFFEFKSHQIRMICYFLPGRLLVVTHGFIKKGDRTPKEQIDRAIRIQKEDTARFSETGGTKIWTH